MSKKYNTGICIRIVCSDFLDMHKLTDDLEQFVFLHNLVYSEVDILIDIQDIFNNESKFFNYAELSQKIPKLLVWRTFIFSSGAFPMDLSKYKPGEDAFEPRLDWNSWEKLIKKGEMKRLPSFSDYTIQHPVYREFTKFLSPSVSIKYTLNNNWHILRGSKGKFEQYLAHANLLANSDEFFKRDYSFGDEYIAEKSEYLREYLDKIKKNKKAGGTGNATTWITASLNHHLECTADQIANLS